MQLKEEISLKHSSLLPRGATPAAFAKLQAASPYPTASELGREWLTPGTPPAWVWVGISGKTMLVSEI